MSDIYKISRLMFGLLLLSLFAVPLRAQQNMGAAEGKVDATVEALTERFASAAQTFRRRRKNVTETWRYSVHDGHLEVFEITYRKGITKYSELYFRQNEELIYAIESEDFYAGAPDEAELITSWTAHYYFDRRRLFNYWSNGHGKSEDDNWEPERETLERYDRRLKTLRAMLPRAGALQKRRMQQTKSIHLNNILILTDCIFV